MGFSFDRLTQVFLACDCLFGAFGACQMGAIWLRLVCFEGVIVGSLIVGEGYERTQVFLEFGACQTGSLWQRKVSLGLL